MTAAVVYSTPDLVEHTGLTFRQLDYYRRKGAIRPSLNEPAGSGYHAVWSERDRDVLIAIGRVTRDLATLDIDAPTVLIGAMWDELHVRGSFLTVLDTVRIRVEL